MATRRSYFYYVSQLGHLYPLESRGLSRLPFGPTYLKERRFLQFFFARVRRTQASDGEATDTWPWLSVCGREMNFVHSASRTPVVFQKLEDGRLWLAEGSMSVPFEPRRLGLSVRGELYHECDDPAVGASLVASNVAFDIMADFETGADGKVRWKGVEIKRLAD